MRNEEGTTNDVARAVARFRQMAAAMDGDETAQGGGRHAGVSRFYPGTRTVIDDAAISLGGPA